MPSSLLSTSRNEIIPLSCKYRCYLFTSAFNWEAELGVGVSRESDDQCGNLLGAQRNNDDEVEGDSAGVCLSC